MPLTPLRINPSIKGVNTITPTRELKHDYAVRMDNIWMDKAGGMQARPGQSSEIPPHTSAIKKLFEYVAPSGSVTLMMQDTSGVIHKRAGATWVQDVAAGTYAGTLGVSQLGSQLILSDGVVEKFYNGTAWAVPTGLTTTPINNHCNVFSTHNGRMYGGGSTAHRTVLFFSDVLATGLGAAAGVADWTVIADPAATKGGFIDITGATGTGDAITGITSFQGLLVVFTANSIVFYNAQDPLTNLSVHKVIRGIGCLNHESIAGIGNTTMFLSQFGFLSLHEILVQGDAAAQKSSTAINNFIADQFSTGAYQANNVSAVYAQELGVYLCSFGTTVTWAYHEMFGGWTPWFGLPSKLFVSSDNTVYMADTELVSIKRTNSQDVIDAGVFAVNFLWEPAPFRSGSQEVKARWNRAELIYESEDNAEVIVSSWINLDKATALNTDVLTLNPSSTVPNPTGMVWATLDANGAVIPSLDPRTKWGGSLNPNVDTWAGTLAGTGILRSGDERIPLIGRSELISFSISSTNNKHLRISAFEVYRNDGGIR